MTSLGLCFLMQPTLLVRSGKGALAHVQSGSSSQHRELTLFRRLALKLEFADNLTLDNRGMEGSVCTSTELWKTNDAIDD